MLEIYFFSGDCTKTEIPSTRRISTPALSTILLKSPVLRISGFIADYFHENPSVILYVGVKPAEVGIPEYVPVNPKVQGVPFTKLAV